MFENNNIKYNKKENKYKNESYYKNNILSWLYWLFYF